MRPGFLHLNALGWILHCLSPDILQMFVLLFMDWWNYGSHPVTRHVIPNVIPSKDRERIWDWWMPVLFLEAPRWGSCTDFPGNLLGEKKQNRIDWYMPRVKCTLKTQLMKVNVYYCKRQLSNSLSRTKKVQLIFKKNFSSSLAYNIESHQKLQDNQMHMKETQW